MPPTAVHGGHYGRLVKIALGRVCLPVGPPEDDVCPLNLTSVQPDVVRGGVVERQVIVRAGAATDPDLEPT